MRLITYLRTSKQSNLIYERVDFVSKSLMKKALLILFFCWFSFSQAQEFPSCIKVLDAETGKVLNRASVSENGRVRKYTNDSGVVVIRLVFPATLHVSFVGYQIQTVELKEIRKDTVHVMLQPAKQQLADVTIYPKLPEFLFFGSYETQVIDYEFADSYTILGLYNYKQRKCYLLILDSNSNIIAEEPLPSDFDHFYKSCILKYYAVSGSVIQEIQFRKGIVMLKYVNDDFFYKKVLYYKGFYKEYFYVMDQHKSKQAHLYYVENTLLKQIVPFVAVGNHHELNKYRRDEQIKGRKRSADLKAMGLDDDEDAPVGYYEKETRGEFIKGSQMELGYKPVVSKLFVEDSTVLVFDFTDGLLSRHSYEGTLRDSIPFSFHRAQGWQPSIEKCEDYYYTSYQDKDSVVTLAKIAGISSLKIQTHQKLRYSGAFQWKVHRGFIYYLYYSLEYPNNQFLFREKLQ